MDKPTPADVRTWAPTAFDWSAYGWEEGVDGDARVAKQIDWAWGYIEAATGRDLDTLTSTTAPDMDLTQIAEQALVLRLIQRGIGSGEAAFAVLEQPWLKSFTAGSYSETRFGPSELGGQSKDVLLKINPWMELAMLLWLLCTQEKRDEWLEVFAGRVRPAGTFIPVSVGTFPREGYEPYDFE